MQISHRILRIAAAFLLLSTFHGVHGLKLFDDILHFKENIIQGVKQIFKKDDCDCPCRDYYVPKCEMSYVQKCHQGYHDELCESVPVYVTHKEKVSECQKCKNYLETVPVTKWVTECNPVYDEKCHTKYLSHCSSDTRCVMIYQTVCKSGYDGYGQHCTNEPRQHCYPETKCHKTPKTSCVPIKKEKCHKVEREVTEQQERFQCLPFASSDAQLQLLGDQNACGGQGFEAIGADGHLFQSDYGEDHQGQYSPSFDYSASEGPDYLGSTGYSASGPSGGNQFNAYGHRPLIQSGPSFSNLGPTAHSQLNQKTKPHFALAHRPTDDAPLGPGVGPTGGPIHYEPSHVSSTSSGQRPTNQNLHGQTTGHSRPTHNGPNQPSGPSSSGIISEPEGQFTASLYPVMNTYPTGGNGPFSQLTTFGAPNDLKSRPSIISSPGFDTGFFKQGLGSNPTSGPGKGFHYTPSGTGFAPPSDASLYEVGSSGIGRPQSLIGQATPPPISGSGSENGLLGLLLTEQPSGTKGYSIDANDDYGVSRQNVGLMDHIYNAFEGLVSPKTQEDHPVEKEPLVNPFLRRKKATRRVRRRKFRRRNDIQNIDTFSEDDFGWRPIRGPLARKSSRQLNQKIDP